MIKQRATSEARPITAKTWSKLNNLTFQYVLRVDEGESKSSGIQEYSTNLVDCLHNTINRCQRVQVEVHPRHYTHGRPQVALHLRCQLNKPMTQRKVSKVESTTHFQGKQALTVRLSKEESYSMRKSRFFWQKNLYSTNAKIDTSMTKSMKSWRST